MTGENQLANASFNIVRGRDPAKRLTKIASFTSLAYRNLYPGIQMVGTGSHGRLSYAFLVEPNSSPDKIRIRVCGIARLVRDSHGNFLMQTESGTVVQPRPHFLEIGRPRGARELKGYFVVWPTTSTGSRFKDARAAPGCG